MEYRKNITHNLQSRCSQSIVFSVSVRIETQVLRSDATQMEVVNNQKTYRINVTKETTAEFACDVLEESTESGKGQVKVSKAKRKRRNRVKKKEMVQIYSPKS